MRLIDADALMNTTERFCSGCYSYNGVRCSACRVDDMQVEIEDAPTVKAIPTDILRNLFIKRMTVDSETKDRRRKDYNQAIFHYRTEDEVDGWNMFCKKLGFSEEIYKDYGETFQCFEPMDMDMVLTCFDNAVKDYFRQNIAKEKEER